MPLQGGIENLMLFIQAGQIFTWDRGDYALKRINSLRLLRSFFFPLKRKRTVDLLFLLLFRATIFKGSRIFYFSERKFHNKFGRFSLKGFLRVSFHSAHLSHLEKCFRFKLTSLFSSSRDVQIPPNFSQTLCAAF